jgi:enoyl-CoA hydratase
LTGPARIIKAATGARAAAIRTNRSGRRPRAGVFYASGVGTILDISTAHCTAELDGYVLTLTMNRPEKRNALSSEMLAGLVLGYEYADEHPEVRCAILTGAGGHFSSGADLVAMGQQSTDPKVQAVMARGNNPHWKALLRDYRLSKPVVAAVEGYAVAGGTEILQGTDIRIAGEGAVFGVWEAKRGLFPLGGSACRLPRQIPYTHAMDILLSCRPIPAVEAREIGLIGRVVPEGTALEAARAVAAQVAANAPLSTQAILRAWRETEHMSDHDAMQHQDTIGWEVFASEDAQEGPQAFAQKRTPVYKGR